jgi:hypothetical protein
MTARQQAIDSKRNLLVVLRLLLSILCPSLSLCVFVVNPSLASAQANRRSLASEHFRVWYPADAEQREIDTVLRALEAARRDLRRRLEAAGVDPAVPSLVEVNIHRTTGDFAGATGQPPWAAGVTRGRRIELQPLAVLRRRGVLATTLRHEYAHVAIEALGRGRTPRWITEGLAAHFAGEGPLLARAGQEPSVSDAELEEKLSGPASAREMRALYAAAYLKVREMIRAEGESSVWRRVAQG